MFQDHFRKRQLQQLSQIQVASPCSADWDEMEGDDKVRFCGECRRHVFNLSAMDVEEAGAKIAEHADGLCVRFFRRTDGMILTQDCPVGVEQARKRRRLAIRTSVEVTIGLALISAVARALISPTLATTGMVAPPSSYREPELLAQPVRVTMGSAAPLSVTAVDKHAAVRYRNLKRLRSLVEADQDAEAVAQDGSTILISAARAGFAEAIPFLLEQGADPAARDRSGQTALDVAKAAGHPEAVGLLRRATRVGR
jgi:hypothetical protein